VNAIDRTIYSTRSMPVASSGGTATDVLRNVPELQVDVDGNVTMQGSQSVAIHINGRPTPIRGEALRNYLQQLPAARIERVEVVPNPSAKYDPEGMAGIVNIVLKDDLGLGLSGSVSASGDTRGRYGSFGSLAWQRGRYTLFGSGNLAVHGSRNRGFDARDNLLARPVTRLEVESDNENDGRFRFVDASLEVRLGARETLYGSVRANGSRFEAVGIARNTLLDDELTVLQRYDYDNDNEFTFGSTDVSLGFRRVLAPQQNEFSLDLRYTGNGNGNRADWVRSFLVVDGTPATIAPELGVNDADTDGDDFSVQADLVRPLGSGYKLEAGYKGAIRATDNEQSLWRGTAPDDAAAELILAGFEYDETYHQGYLTLGRQFGALGLQAGLRAEQATTEFTPRESELHERSYHSLFPSLNLSYAFQGGKQARLSYSKRIERPSPTQLNPDVPSTDPLNRFVGNPDLEPKYTHNFTLDLSQTAKFGMIRISPFFRHTVNNWDYFKQVDSAGVATLTWLNTDAVDNYGATATVSLRFAEHGNGFLSLNAYRYVRDASSLSTAYSGDGFRWELSGNGSLRVRRGIDVQGFVRYAAPQDLPQGRVGANVFSNLGARAELVEKKLHLNVSVMDPFDVYRFRFETSDGSHVQTSRNRISMRAARVGLSYTFGRAPQSARRPPEPNQQPTEPQPVIR
jgi:outer membrane receptor protein involved in Fe transport